MALPHRSIAVESGIEFINLQPLDINPLMSACEIKVFYLGKNRNHSYIDKEVATEMAKTLRGAPIVGYYKKDKEDFADHGEQIIFDDEGIHFNCLTVPYGFVSPDSKVWFQDFEEEDAFGNKITRTYLMTTGYIWTGQFEEAKKVFEDNGKPHSMELDKNSVKGTWAEDFNDNIEFFIISDAIFSKLCILGDDVEPCFEGSSVTEPIVSKNFTLDDKFKNTLFSMLNELKQVLKGDTGMPENEVMDNVTTEFDDNSGASDSSNSSTETTTETTEGGAAEETQNGPEGTQETEGQGTQAPEGEGTQGATEGEGEGEDVPTPTPEDDLALENGVNGKKEEFSLEQYEELQTNYSKLQDELNELKATLTSLKDFKHNVEDKQKDALIAKFFMLSDEDKKDVIENKDKYTLEEIESKLATIGFRKGVNFNLTDENESEENEDEVSTVYTLDENANNSIPDWVKAVKENEQ